MIFDLVRFALLTLAAADLQADLSSARAAAFSFEDVLCKFSYSSTGNDVPTTMTSDYESFLLAFSSFNGALEGVGVNGLTSGSTALYEDVARAVFWVGYVVHDLGDLARLNANKTGNIFSFMQDALESVDEPSVELVEKVNSMMIEDCRLARNGYDASESFSLLEDISRFTSQFSRAVERVMATASPLPNLSCLDGASSLEENRTHGEATITSTSLGGIVGSSTGGSPASTDETLTSNSSKDLGHKFMGLHNGR